MASTRVAAAMVFVALTLSTVAAAACSCFYYTGTAYVADTVPSDFTGIAVELQSAAVSESERLELQVFENGGWVTVGSTDQSGLLSPRAPWSQGERYRVHSPDDALIYGADREFDIGPPLGPVSDSLVLTVSTELNRQLCTPDDCLIAPPPYSEEAIVEFGYPTSLEPYAELVQVEEFVDGQTYRSPFQCAPQGPFPGNQTARVALPCGPDDADDPGEIVLLYNATVPGAPQVTLGPATTTVRLSCGLCDVTRPDAGTDAGPDGGTDAGPDAGPDEASDDSALTGGCSSAHGNPQASLVVLLLALMVAGRMRRRLVEPFTGRNLRHTRFDLPRRRRSTTPRRNPGRSEAGATGKLPPSGPRLVLS